MNGLRNLVFVVATLTTGYAVAQTRVEARPNASMFAKSPCPAGTRAVERSSKFLELQACAKVGADGQERFEGPFRAFDKQGRLEAVGQKVNGLKEGKWTFFDGTGAVMGETHFRGGIYHGERVQYFADGRVKAREQWVNGKREGPQRVWDEAGKESVVEYRGDAPVIVRR